MNHTQSNGAKETDGMVQFLMQSFGYTLYAFDPSETYHNTYKEMPDFVSKAAPGVFTMMVLEFFIKFFFKSAGSWRLSDTVVNISSATLAEGFKSFFYRGIEMTAYSWIFENYRLIDLPFDSPYTYIFAIIGVDFGHYWWHRASHETSLIWAAHHLHHSSDDFTFSTAMRNSFTMRPFLWFWFLHMAVLGLPPATYMAHLQLGFLYGAWNHNHWIPKLGKIVPVLGDVVEFVMSTPSHHRVHHGANKYCIDRNFGFVLIIWDRIFGTYAEERDEEPITYGSIKQTRSFDVIGIHVESWKELYHKVKRMTNFGDRLRAVFYGPGWIPGESRLGNPNDMPDVSGRPKYEIYLPWWLSTYLSLHACILFFSYLDMMHRLDTIDGFSPMLNFCYILFTMTSLGGLYDAKVHSIYMEPVRLLVHLGLLQYFPLIGNAQHGIGITFTHMFSLLLVPSIIRNINKRQNNDEGGHEIKGEKTRSVSSAKDLNENSGENLILRGTLENKIKRQ